MTAISNCDTQDGNRADAKVGDVIVLWNMPYPVGTFLIRLATGVNCDHCSIVLPKDKDDPKPYVYEAALWKVRKMPVVEYWKQIESWGKSRRLWRRLTKKKLCVEVWSSPADLSISEMLVEAEGWMGAPYGMVFNYLFKGARYVFNRPRVHCSEYLSRILRKGVLQWDKEPSRVTPIDVRDSLQAANWSHTSCEVDYRSIVAAAACDSRGPFPFCSVWDRETALRPNRPPIE